ncbi:MAG TPA: quinone-dependent dihydroorotate dehydrogenase [Caulobacteraceae bacterium]|nr:quinone-dependent dihydroorotate dehydrogenase [Caulobacteraceae bacterium]
MSRAHALAADLLSRLDPESAHRLTIQALRAGLGPRDREASDPILATALAGLAIRSPIGLAAGFDKNAEVAGPMLAAGFGFVECGTVTPLAQPGNPRPRLFRLREDRALINRLGFNNAGHAVFAAGLARRPGAGVVGVNIGANKDSPDRIADYVAGLRRFWGLGDYFAVNISSPNTPGLRALQSGQALVDLLGAVSEARDELRRDRDCPIFLKVAPDLEDREIAGIVEAALDYRLQGLIVSNTTLDRPDGLVSGYRGEAGGLSGAPLMERSTRVLREARRVARGRLCLVGVGGVASGADAYAKIRAGADATQLYTALVYRGPGLVAEIRRDLAARLRADGFRGVAEAVGAQ